MRKWASQKKTSPWLVADDATTANESAAPTRAGILRELAVLGRRVHTGDTVLICFSGHGVEIGGKSYLLPSDADALDEGTLADTSIEVGKVRERLKQIPADLLLLAFDMCRTYPIKTGREGVSPPNPLTKGFWRGLDFNLSASAAPARKGPRVVVRLWSCAGRATVF